MHEWLEDQGVWVEGRTDSLRMDEKKERRIDGNYFGEMCAQNLPEASSTLHVKCRGKDMKAEAPTQPYDKIKSNPQNLFDEDFLNRLLSAHFI